MEKQGTKEQWEDLAGSVKEAYLNLMLALDKANKFMSKSDLAYRDLMKVYSDLVDAKCHLTNMMLKQLDSNPMDKELANLFYNEENK